MYAQATNVDVAKAASKFLTDLHTLVSPSCETPKAEVWAHFTARCMEKVSEEMEALSVSPLAPGVRAAVDRRLEVRGQFHSVNPLLSSGYTTSVVYMMPFPLIICFRCIVFVALILAGCMCTFLDTHLCSRSQPHI